LADLQHVQSNLDPIEAPPAAAPPPQPSAAPKHLDVGAFGQALHATLKDAVAGYVMQMRKNGTTIYTLEWNWARRPGEGALGWNPDRLMHIASVSKLITGIGMARLLDEKGISFDAKIIDYLPAYWTKGPFVNQVSFRNLMTHTSGFITGGSASDYATMRNRVAMGSIGIGKYSYENMNYGLCVVLMAVLTGARTKGDQFGTLNDLIWSTSALSAYTSYIQQKVFGPAGVFSATLDHNSDCALAYSFPVVGGGWDSGALAANAGGAGWHMSVRQVLDVMDAYRRRNTILPAAKATAAMDAAFGIDVISDTPAGRLYNKNGAWGSGGHTEQAQAYFLPENMELVVFANSNIGVPAKSFRKTVTDLYLSHLV
jgi:CubicO group peptidase (beta-lactamase class C family)